MSRPSLRLASSDGVAPRAVAPTSASSYQPFAGHPPAVVESTLKRIVESRTFRRSRRHQQFLAHVVHAALDGRHDELKEVVIALDVFGRDLADYDPRRDPIVRVEAGRVREKLTRYYESEGADDPFEIHIPVGGYLPQLSSRAARKSNVRSLGSFAVMPFANLSPLAEDAIFCEALSNQIVDTLARTDGVRVVGRMSASKAKAQSGDMKVVGKLLGATHLVEGSVQHTGRRYRCIAQVYRARDRLCLWSERFQCEVDEHTDLFEFQDRIADAVAASLAASAKPRDAARVETARPPRAVSVDVAARDLYERARYLVQLRTNEALEKGIELLERSIALDANFAPAHSQLGIARSTYFGIMARPTVAAFREVEASARRALALDPDDGDARALIANIAFRIDRDWPRAEPMMREALQAGPNSVTAHLAYAGALVFNGRFLEAIEHARIALDLDPLNITVRINLAVITAYARDYRTAVDEFRAVLDLDPDHWFAHVMLGSTLLWAGRPDDAMPHFDLAVRIAPDHPIPQFDRVFVFGARGEPDVARTMLGDLLARLDGKDYQLYNRAMAEAFIGDVDAMCRTLRRSAAAHELLFVSVPADPTFDRYRDHPAFVALTGEFGLPRLPPSPFASSI